MTRQRQRPDLGRHTADGLRDTITIKTVAKQAGVSTATVSRALSGSGYVSPELHSAVTRAAQELGYTSNAVAAALRNSRTHTVGLIVPEITDGVIRRLIQKVEKDVAGVGMHLLLRSSHQDADKERQAIASMIAHRVDGLIVYPALGALSQSTVRTITPSIPCVEVQPGRFCWSTRWIGRGGEPNGVMLRLIQHLSASSGSRDGIAVTP